MRFIILTLLLLFAPLSFACDVPADDTVDESPEAGCVETSRWQIGVALGAGVRTNPLEDGDHIPLVVLPDIAWYGEKAYFDNGELGYQFIDTRQWGAEAYLTIDRERAFFSFWQPANVFVPDLGFAADTPALSGPAISAEPEFARPSVSIDRVASRDWALHAGARVRWYSGSHGLRASWEEDVSNTHDGSKAVFSYSYATEYQGWQFAISPSLIWKSDRLVNYYYGLSSRDNLPLNQFYVAQGGWQPALSVRVVKPLSKRWQFLMFSSYQRLHSSMRNSPLVRSGNIRSIFIGAGYTF